MYLSHFHLQNSPFGVRTETPVFYPSSVHQEALARLEFLVANRRALGLVLGPAGTGKSTILHVLSQRLRRRGCNVARTGLVGLSCPELLRSLTMQLGCGERNEMDVSRLWLRLSDALADSRRLQKQTVFLLDDVHTATQDMQALLLRLVHADPSPEARHTVVLACDATYLEHLAKSLRDRVDLRVDLEPWTVDDTGAYLKAALAEAGGDDDLFDIDAIAQIHAIASGIPRHVSRLADLSLVAAAGQRCDHVDGEIVEAVAGELVAC